MKDERENGCIDIAHIFPLKRKGKKKRTRAGEEEEEERRKMSGMCRNGRIGNGEKNGNGVNMLRYLYASVLPLQMRRKNRR